MKHQMKVFSSAGDTLVAEYEETDEAAVAVGKAVFDQAKKDGFAAVEATAEGAKPLDTFKPEVEEIWLIKPIAGG